GWFLFSFEVFNAALLLYSFELLYQRGKWYWFALPIFFIGISRPFNLWMYALFLGLYIVYRLISDGEKIASKKTVLLFAKIIGVAVIGLGLSAPVLFEHIQTIIDSPRGSGPDSYSGILSSAPMFHTADKMEFGTGMMRFFANDILGSGIKFKGWQNFLEAPVFYCGIPCLLLCTQYFQFLKKPVKRVAIALFVLWLLPVVFPYFRQAIWLFSGDYYRTYSFFVALVMIFFSVNAFDKLLKEKKVNLLTLLITTGILLCLINYPYFTGKDVVDGGIRFFAEISVLIYAALIYFMAKNKDDLNYRYIFIAWLFIELTYFSWCTVNRREHVTVKDLAAKVGYNDYSVEALNYVKQTDKSFYRIDKTYASTPAMHGSLNDGMVQGYYGTSSYNPFNQKYYINYLKTMGIINKVNELESRWSPGLINRFILQSLNDVKYIFSKNGYAQPLWRFSHDSVAKFGDVLVLKNKFALPLGFGYSKYVKLSAFEKLSLTQKDLVSTKACVLNDEDVARINGLSPFNLSDTLPVAQFTFDVLKQNIDSLRKTSLQVNEFKPTSIKASVNLPAGEMVYASIPFDKGWSVSDNGTPVEKMILSNGMTGIFLAKGPHQVEFTYTSLNLKKGILISVISFCIFIATLFVAKRTKVLNN
ncbi:MAG TPA: YfhO family protein, partial [Bacteroidia bacterium]|nr:YfhO family protein [Bacteroidia bacterium]